MHIVCICVNIAFPFIIIPPGIRYRAFGAHKTITSGDNDNASLTIIFSGVNYFMPTQQCSENRPTSWHCHVPRKTSAGLLCQWIKATGNEQKKM